MTKNGRLAGITDAEVSKVSMVPPEMGRASPKMLNRGQKGEDVALVPLEMRIFLSMLWD